MVQDPTLLNTLYTCSTAHIHSVEFIIWAWNKKRKRGKGGKGGGLFEESRERQHCSTWYEVVTAHHQPHFANFGGFVFLAIFYRHQSKGVLMRVWRRIMRYFCRCLQGVPPHSKGQHVQRHFEKQVSNGGWHLSSFETKGPDADLIYTGESCNSCEVNEVPVA